MIKESDDSYQGVSYSFAHKKIKDNDLVAVSIRGMKYYEEWAGNFDIGASGNHKNFDKCASLVYASLKEYMTKYPANTKMLISGYSRSAGISNIVADKIMKDSEKIVLDDNLYVYTFESPKAMKKDDCIAYPNVFNIINSADLVTYLPMDEFGFSRCGIDKDIYNANASSIIKEFDDTFILPEFKKYLGNDITNDLALPPAIIKNLISYRANPNSETYLDDFLKIDPSGKASRLFTAIPSELTKNASRYQVTSVLGRSEDKNTMNTLLKEMEDSLTVNFAHHATDPNVGLPMVTDYSQYKMYVGDTGLFITLAFWDKDFTENIIYQKLLSDKLSANLGYVYENIVAQMLIATGNKLFYHTWPSETSNHNYEVDFILSRGSKICPIEVKSSGYKTHKSLDEFCSKFSNRVSDRFLIYTKDLRHDEQTLLIPTCMTMHL